ncbi:hypothetical protein BIY24_05670 [Halobacteriovorax marinus]|uniref:NnrS family protein n=1 Tax=Halobacteriovorax marinus TaxID=97084 RepID=UPI000BC340D6|nr:NnrS family protein [Halobacteriovorax marinus]ATH07447.1 hypothetical protein BIY24_05670 [Halobacteriovorax marinus]
MYFLQAPFRPFFTLTALAAIFIPMYFVGILVNGYYINEAYLSSSFWHAHEMIFGFTSALLSGFLLTAAPKWRQVKAVSSGWTLLLVTSWIFARVIMVSQPSELSIYFFCALPLILLIIKLFLILGRTPNAFIALPLLLALLISELLSIYGAINEHELLLESAYHLMAFIIAALLIIFSGRLIPFFVNSKFQTQLIHQNKKLDLTIVAVSFAMLVLTISGVKFATTTLSFICFLLLCIRFKLYFSKKILRVPMLWILFLGHLWLIFYFLLNSLAPYMENLAEARAVFHALYAGALGIFAIGMMSRVSLGHSGLEMKATKLITFSFISILVGAFVRVLHPIFMGGLDGTLLHISMGFWTLSFILYLIYFFPKFITLRD